LTLLKELGAFFAICIWGAKYEGFIIAPRDRISTSWLPDRICLAAQCLSSPSSLVAFLTCFAGATEWRARSGRFPSCMLLIIRPEMYFSLPSGFFSFSQQNPHVWITLALLHGRRPLTKDPYAVDMCSTLREIMRLSGRLICSTKATARDRRRADKSQPPVLLLRTAPLPLDDCPWTLRSRPRTLKTFPSCPRRFDGLCRYAAVSLVITNSRPSETI